jgi:hypothetical protein
MSGRMPTLDLEEFNRWTTKIFKTPVFTLSRRAGISSHRRNFGDVSDIRGGFRHVSVLRSEATASTTHTYIVIRRCPTSVRTLHYSYL